MAEFREKPYTQFNFLVDLGTGNADGYDAGFQEISAIGTELAVTEYRNGNDKENNVRKIIGLNKASDVTLKRGICGSLTLFTWFDQVRRGDPGGTRNITIHLMSENREKTVFTWRLQNARPIKYTCGPMNAKGSDVGVEEFVLSYERLAVE